MVEPMRPPPPAFLRQDRVMEVTAAGERSQAIGKRRGARFGRAEVEHPRLVVALETSQQTVPIVSPEKRPRCESADGNTFPPELVRTVPGLHQPADLLIAGAAEMAFGNCHLPL